MEMIWTAVGTGLVAGVVHVSTGPDHLAAVAPLSVGNGPRGWRIGMQWGLGHCGGVLLIGLLALLFREMLPLEAVSASAERLVGMLLIGVGTWGICKIVTRGAAWRDASPYLKTPKAAFVIGTVHGLAGSSHLLGVVPGLLFPAPAVYAYFMAFAVGTLATMGAFSLGLANLPQRLHRVALTGSSCAAVGIGCYWLII
jgi:hypothetical protein